MVHRIENTLLIDEFDIRKHLLRTAETEWEWLKKFFYDHVLKSLSDKVRCKQEWKKYMFTPSLAFCVLKFKFINLPQNRLLCRKYVHEHADMTLCKIFSLCFTYKTSGKVCQLPTILVLPLISY